MVEFYGEHNREILADDLSSGGPPWVNYYSRLIIADNQSESRVLAKTAKNFTPVCPPRRVREVGSRTCGSLPPGLHHAGIAARFCGPIKRVQSYRSRADAGASACRNRCAILRTTRKGAIIPETGLEPVLPRGKGILSPVWGFPLFASVVLCLSKEKSCFSHVFLCFPAFSCNSATHIATVGDPINRSPIDHQ